MEVSWFPTYSFKSKQFTAKSLSSKSSYSILMLHTTYYSGLNPKAFLHNINLFICLRNINAWKNIKYKNFIFIIWIILMQLTRQLANNIEMLKSPSLSLTIIFTESMISILNQYVPDLILVCFLFFKMWTITGSSFKLFRLCFILHEEYLHQEIKPRKENALLSFSIIYRFKI
jgi:hypothetical protein